MKWPRIFASVQQVLLSRTNGILVQVSLHVAPQFNLPDLFVCLFRWMVWTLKKRNNRNYLRLVDLTRFRIVLGPALPGSNQLQALNHQLVSVRNHLQTILATILYATQMIEQLFRVSFTNRETLDSSLYSIEMAWISPSFYPNLPPFSKILNKLNGRSNEYLDLRHLLLISPQSKA